MEEVRQVVNELESGEPALGEALEAFEKGIGRLKDCQEILNAAEAKVSLLSGFDAAGNPITEPMPEMNEIAGAGRRRGTKTAAKSTRSSPTTPAPPSAFGGDGEPGDG